jgi:type VI protein secretion system component VasF
MSTPIDAKAQAAKAQAERARDDLASTLDAIEDKFNVPKRVTELGERAASAYRQNPVPWIIGGVAVAVIAVGLVAWAIFSGDDD